MRHPAMQFEGEVQVCPDPFHPITEHTITDEQCDEVWRLGAADGVHGNPDTMHLATVAVNRTGDFTAIEQRAARMSCARLLNERAKAVSK
jgi:hypothetical protein